MFKRASLVYNFLLSVYPRYSVVANFLKPRHSMSNNHRSQDNVVVLEIQPSIP